MISGFFASFLFVVEIKIARFCLKTEPFFFELELRLETTTNPHIHRDLTSCLQLKTIVFRRGVVSLSHVLWRTSYMTQQQGVHSTLALLLFVKLTRCGRKSFDWQLLVNNWVLNAAGFYWSQFLCWLYGWGNIYIFAVGLLIIHHICRTSIPPISRYHWLVFSTFFNSKTIPSKYFPIDPFLNLKIFISMSLSSWAWLWRFLFEKNLRNIGIKARMNRVL